MTTVNSIRCFLLFAMILIYKSQCFHINLTKIGRKNIVQKSLLSKFKTFNLYSNENSEVIVIKNDSSVLTFSSNLENLNKLYMRCSWISWWVQIILSVISGVILTFANTVRQGSLNSYSFWTSGFAFSSIGVFVSLINAIWTWNVTRLCRRINSNAIKAKSIIPTLKRYSSISVVLSLIGMFISLLGAEQIVGTLAAKILSNQGFVPIISMNNAASTSGALQALDIFLVQANTNSLVAHFSSLVCYLSLKTQLPQINYQNITYPVDYIKDNQQTNI